MTAEEIKKLTDDVNGGAEELAKKMEELLELAKQSKYDDVLKRTISHYEEKVREVALSGLYSFSFPYPEQKKLFDDVKKHFEAQGFFVCIEENSVYEMPYEKFLKISWGLPKD